MSQEEQSTSFDPRGPLQTPKRTENAPQNNGLPLARFYADAGRTFWIIQIVWALVVGALD